MMPIKIVIADDHKLFRGGLRSLLEQDENFLIQGEASDGKELIELIKKEMPDIALVDITMPEMTGLEVIDYCTQNISTIKCIALTMHDDGSYAYDAIKKGAYGYLLKNTDERELKEAIRSVHEGKKYFNQHISELVFNRVSAPEEDAKLTPREREVLKLVAEGKTTKEIADELFVSTRTIESHRANMMEKLHVHNTAELIKVAVNQGFV